MLKTINVCSDVIALFLQRILQDSVAFQALTLLLDLRVKKRLLAQQQRLLSRT